MSFLELKKNKPKWKKITFLFILEISYPFIIWLIIKNLRLPSLSGLTPIKFYIELTHLGSKASKYYLDNR